MTDFHNFRFPLFASKVLHRKIIFNTDIVATYDDKEIRKQSKHIRYEYTLPEIRFSKLEAQELESFFIARRGMVFSFRLKDMNDWKAENQKLGLVNDKKLQLIKTYQDGNIFFSRFITKPRKNGMKIMLSGKEIENSCVNYDTGEIALDRNLINDILVEFEFDIHVRFAMDVFSKQLTDEGCYIVNNLKLIEVPI